MDVPWGEALALFCSFDGQVLAQSDGQVLAQDDFSLLLLWFQAILECIN